jgi:hypothetical protein
MVEAALGAAVGAAAGGAAGLVVAVLQLLLKRLRNGVLLRRGASPRRDCVRTRLEIPGALAGLVIAAIVAPRAGIGWASLAACAPAAVLLALIVASVLHQAYRTPPCDDEPQDRAPSG